MNDFEREVIADGLMESSPFHAWIIRESITEKQISAIHDIFEYYQKQIGNRHHSDIDNEESFAIARTFFEAIKSVVDVNVYNMLVCFNLSERWNIVTRFLLLKTIDVILKMDNEYESRKETVSQQSDQEH